MAFQACELFFRVDNKLRGLEPLSICKIWLAPLEGTFKIEDEKNRLMLVQGSNVFRAKPATPDFQLS